MNTHPGETFPMGPQLCVEVERQLLKDLQRYAYEHSGDFTIDWSDICPEGHATTYLDGCLENWSDVWLVNAQGERIAWGWIDFIHGGGDHPLFVFLLFLHFGENAEDAVGAHGGIPQHIWDTLPESTKDLCLQSEAYDAAWGNNPLVIQWRNQKLQR